MKLIAVRPLDGCHKDFLKILTIGKLYQFYSGYTFTPIKADGKVFTEARYKRDVLDGKLYSVAQLQGSLPINISAVVGRNGSGKSTLIELFFALVYLTSIDHDVLETKNLKAIEKVRKRLRAEAYYSLGESIYCIRYDGSKQDPRNPGTTITELLGSTTINLEGNNTLVQVLDKNSNLTDHFFYSIAVNYSIYGLNSLHIGQWINALFHKNDGYQTPLVINPMRKRGVFNINEENYFAKSRLLSNLLHPEVRDTKSHRYITDSQKATSLIFTINAGKIKTIFSHETNKNTTTLTMDAFYGINGQRGMLEAIYTKLIGVSNYWGVSPFTSVRFYREVEQYIVKKLVKIATTYNEYLRFFNLEVPKDAKGELQAELQYTFNDFDAYLTKLKGDSSHITFKLNQAINYLRHDYLKEDSAKNILWKKGNANTERPYSLEISIDELSDRINGSMKEGESLIDHIPPSLFKVDIKLSDTMDGELLTSFKDLSSGEQQMVHSIQSIVYHLINVNSVFDQPQGSDEPAKETYSSINLILDEIELYFHPDYQRMFISELLKSIERTDIGNIKGINILFSTHSPFILSDIPNSNILFLKKEEDAYADTSLKTFGANLYDLLADGFFLRNGVIGAFAHEKIQDAIDDLNLEDRHNPNTGFTEVELFGFIKNVGEPFLRKKMEDMYYSKYPDKFDNELLINELKNKLKELEG